MIKDKAGIAPGQVGRVTWTEEERMKVGYDTPGWQGVAWAPSN